MYCNFCSGDMMDRFSFVQILGDIIYIAIEQSLELRFSFFLLISVCSLCNNSI